MDIRLIVAGSGPERPRYEKFVSDHNLKEHVHLLGFVPNEELPSVYRSCDVYCSPALGGETFGIVLIEAMASGTPVAASRIAGYEQVINDGQNGLLFDPHSPEDIKEKLASVLTNDHLKKTLVKNGLACVKEYDWSYVTDRLVEIYLSAIREK
jgi:phosphatidylinositol alpha-mannosyltransferase